MQTVLFWNDAALETHRRDFASGARMVNGPTQVSRALAIVHAAIYNAQEATAPRPGGPRCYEPAGLPAPELPTGELDPAGAVAGAATATLKRLWPGQSAFIDETLQQFCDQQLAAGGSGAALMAGADFGASLGLAMADFRHDDGHARPDAPVFVNAPGHHQPDPAQPAQQRLSTHWGRLRPFLIGAGAGGLVDHTRYLGPPPALGTPRYEAAAADVMALGRSTSLGPLAGERQPEQTLAGIFWGYDGPPQLGVPPRLYNQVVRAFVQEQARAGLALTDAEAAHLLALVHMAMADAAIVAWAAKYHYDLWRPVLGLRQGATGLGPNNGSLAAALPAVADPGWLPLGIPRTGLPGQFHHTPDFPAYPSGHATFGAAACRVAALFYAARWGRPVADFLRHEGFDFVSEEYDGSHRDAAGVLRPLVTRRLTLASAIVDNAVSRVYLGVHWRFDGLGTVAPPGLEGEPLPPDPAAAVPLPAAQELRLGGVAAGLRIADEAVLALP
jgi:PAP2 superfamily/Vanadium chloroperoxidase N-terminal domain